MAICGIDCQYQYRRTSGVAPAAAPTLVAANPLAQSPFAGDWGTPSNPLAQSPFGNWGQLATLNPVEVQQTAIDTVKQAAQNNLNPIQAVHSALTNAQHNGLNQANTALMAAIAAVTAAAEHGLGPQAAVEGLVANGMDPDQAQQLVGTIVARTAEESKGFEIPGIQNFLHGLTNQFAQLFSLPPGPPQDIAREAPFVGDVAGGKGNPAVSIETASGKDVHDISIETASGKGGLDNIAIAPAPVSQDPTLSDLYAVATPDLSSQLGLNGINVNDFGTASPGFEALGPTETTFDVGPSQQVSPSGGPSFAQQDLGPQQTLSPVENILPLPSVEINPQFLDPVGPSIELSPYSPSLSPTAPAPAPSPSSNPAISHAPPASQLNPTQAAQILLAAGLPAQSLDAFASSGLSPRKLLQLLQEGWDANKITDMVSRFASDEGHADGGRAEHDPYADFAESENIEDRRLWDTGGMPRRWNFRANWDPDYVDRPARGLERSLGRDYIPSHHRPSRD
jgi:hypothetical protein